MKLQNTFLPVILLAATVIMGASCSENNVKDAAPSVDTSSELKAPAIKEENIEYTEGKVTGKGFMAYDSSFAGPKPVVLIVHEWWGVNDYVKSRARQLASLGYLAMAVDMFGNGRLNQDPKSAQDAVTPFYKDPLLGKSRLEAALAKVKTLPQADTTQIAAIGYCFGGSMVLNAAKLGTPLIGVVSFHGGLAGPAPVKNAVKAQILVCHGSADQFVSASDISTFRNQLDSAGIPYTFKEYAGATHAFSNPDATEKGKKFNIPIAYNGAADTASWNDMLAFFGQVFKK